MKKYHKTLLFVLSILLLFVGVLAFLVLSEEKLKSSDYIAGLSSISIVFLTAAYVFITSRQLAAMKEQLDEMKMSREQASQPIAFITPSKLILEKPRLYFSPPEKRYNGHSRFHVECRVTNPGNAPALSVNVCSCIVLRDKSEEQCGSFKSVMEYVDMLPVLQFSDNSIPISFMFSNDYSGGIIASIRESKPERAPELRICSVYKNVLGACFSCRQAFQLHYNMAEQDDIFENWQSQISAFDIILKREIIQMKDLGDKNDEKWQQIFDESKEKYGAAIKGEDQELMAVQIPKSFIATTIPVTRYLNMLSRGHYGYFLGSRNECIFDNL